MSRTTLVHFFVTDVFVFSFFFFFLFVTGAFFLCFLFFFFVTQGWTPEGCGVVWWCVGCVVWVCRVVCGVCRVGCGVCRVGCVFKIFVGASKIWASPDPPSPDRPHFRSFFPLPPQFLSFLLSLEFFSIFYFSQFWWCFLSRQDTQMHTIGVLGLSCEAPASSGGGGVRRRGGNNGTMRPTKQQIVDR